MSVRVVARIRPLLSKEADADVIVTAGQSDEGKPVVKIPSPKNEAEEFTFGFNSVYDQPTTQEQLFTSEVAPHVKALFQGLDVTIFAYGVTGTGKTHTMRGGLRLADRGVIPRLLSNIYRRAKKIMKESKGDTSVGVALSYYEIYNDKVYDLLEPPEKRSAAGLPLREKDGKTIVVGLSERPCQDLKDFERLYIEANNNRVTAATKLNAHSSRSHAILRVKLTQSTGDMIRESTASAIDLAGSEDNRRTDNVKERMVESAAINKSLFVLSQCIDAISKGDKRIPYRESKMTRILSLGQNNGITIMILNLAPLRSYHLDTLSSLNVSSRAKRIEVREIENEIVFKTQPPRAAISGLAAPSAARQPLRPLASVHNALAGAIANKDKDKPDRPVKAFSVYSDRPAKPAPRPVANSTVRRITSGKRTSDPEHHSTVARNKAQKPSGQSEPSISAELIEKMVEKKVAEILANREKELKPTDPEPQYEAQVQITEEVQKRLDALEKKVECSTIGGDEWSAGLRFIMQARQAKEVGDDEEALRNYELALPYFPGQAKLVGKIDRLKKKLSKRQASPKKQRGGTAGVKSNDHDAADSGIDAGDEVEQRRLEKLERFSPAKIRRSPLKKERKRKHVPQPESDCEQDADADYKADAGSDFEEEEESCLRRKTAKSSHTRKKSRTSNNSAAVMAESDIESDPRSAKLLQIVNSRDEHQLRSLRGFGAKKAKDVLEFLGGLPSDEVMIETVGQLRSVPGMGGRAIERALEGLAC